MAEAAITAVLFKLGDLAVSEANLLLHVRDDIILLRDRLEWLQAFVRDTDGKRRAGTDGLTLVWARQTRDVAFEAEDAIDDFFHDEVVGLHSKYFSQGLRMLHVFFKKIGVRYGFSDRITRIKSRLDRISDNQKEYNIEYTPSLVLASSTTATAAWRDDMENAVGFEEDVNILKQMLGLSHSPKKKKRKMSEHISEPSPRHPMFISIVGESGAGKNTLARIIRREMNNVAKVVVWYHMEPGSSPADLLEKVCQQASTQCVPALQQGEEVISFDIGDKLRHLLAGHRYLLILSGISSKTVLNSLAASLHDPNRDGASHGHVMLILDTENEEIAWHANTMNINGVNGVHLLTQLDRARSGKLFFWKVFRKGQYETSSYGEETSERCNWEDDWSSKMDKERGKKEQSRKNDEDNDRDVHERLVHDITGGYPMAIVLLAGLLRFKEKPVQWNAVLRQLKSANGTQDHGEVLNRNSNQLCIPRKAIEMVFWASFEDLPNDLKSCLLYFASYPENFSRPADQLVRMWIGEGFIRPHKRKTMEEVGQDYLKELVLRCLVEVEEKKADGGIRLVRVHKSLMGFLQLEARESGFMEIQDINDVLVPPAARRLSIHSDNNRSMRYTTTFTTHQNLPKLRSFVCHIIIDDHLHDFKFLSSAKFIRVISVRWFKVNELPHQIGDMIQLRYLRLDCPNLCVLPGSIARLLNLQTLDISNTKVNEIDLDFWKIKTLRHVLANKLMLPTAIPVIVVEHGNSGSSELQTLHGVRPIASEQWSAVNCLLRNMTNLRSLEMQGFKDAMHSKDVFAAALSNMPHLGHLNLEGDEIPSCVFTDQSLRSLQTMELRGIVNWEGITAVVGRRFRKFRPNLVQLKLQDVGEVPQSIQEQLGTILDY